jgi:hopene-associated glycosyltransferase HpnB
VVADDLLSILAALSLALWLGLAGFRGGFWRADQVLPADTPAPSVWPTVVAVVPARNEASTIAAAVRSLLKQRYEGELRIVVVDDDSTDGTAAVAAGVDGGRVDVLSGQALPAGWAGKVWALHQGIDRAAATVPAAQFLLLTDADIEHDPHGVRRLVALAENRRLDLASLMVRLHCSGFWERLLIPAFVFFFQKLYPFPWVNDPRSRTAAAAGGCMLVRRSALDAAGSIERIRDRLIDDCALAALLKRRGLIWIGLATTTRSLRPYGGLAGIWRMVARTAFVQLNHSAWALMATVLAMALLYAMPVAAVVAGIIAASFVPTALGAAAWFTMALLARPTWGAYGLPATWALLLPAAGVLYTGMTVESACRHWTGQGNAWKGRRYADTGTDRF